MISRKLSSIKTTLAHNQVPRKALIKIGELKSKIQTVNYAWLEPGQFFDPHIHNDCEEIYFFIDGSGKMEINNKKINVSNGDFFVVKIGESHGLKNTSKKTLTFLTIRVLI